MAVSLPPVKVNKSTVKQNLFSKHDNRHTLQSCGEYFGQGLGKRIEKYSNQHLSQDHTSWGSKLVYSSTYKQGYNGLAQPCTKTDETLLNKFHVLTKENFRRFPHKHELPRNHSKTRSEELVSTVLWYKDQERTVSSQNGRRENPRFRSYTTPLSVLAATQQPYLRHGHWRYSYKQ